ncbi:hypothetical protein ABEB36_000213 [Hypothenemus hampei]|uniref:Uncharacterized protein n=1 Tax=Hypothenemus hampei TaxID=57062 RepID=A0ABD1FD65_HYPHA
MSDQDCLKMPSSSKKRHSYGRIRDATKKLKLQSHETGDSCNCARLKCFENISKAETLYLIRHFNELKTHYEQNLYLGGLISHRPVKRHRSRKMNDEDVNYHSASYTYKIRILRDNKSIEVPICYKAMLSLHGISAKRLQNIQDQLRIDGHVKSDGRGKHLNRRNKLPQATLDAVFEHIKSFQGRKSHYSLHDSERIYLSEELNVKKCTSCTYSYIQIKRCRMKRTAIFSYPNLTLLSDIHVLIHAVPVMNLRQRN